MSLVVVDSGKNVYSDKEMSEFFGSRVYFTDGSWCDVKTGESYVNGTGFVNVSDVDSQTHPDKVVSSHGRYVADQLEVRNVDVEIHVEVYEGLDIECSVVGPVRHVGSIRTEVRKGRLVIEGGATPSSGEESRVTETRDRSGRGIITGRICVDGSDATLIDDSDVNATAKLTIKIPRGTPVGVRGTVGNTIIGDTLGPLVVSTEDGNVYAGRVTSARLRSLGDGSISIHEVDGYVFAQAQGSGCIYLDKGTSPLIAAGVIGVGEVRFGGVAQDSILTVRGPGRITVYQSANRPIKTVLEGGTVQVSNFMD